MKLKFFFLLLLVSILSLYFYGLNHEKSLDFYKRKSDEGAVSYQIEYLKQMMFRNPGLENFDKIEGQFEIIASNKDFNDSLGFNLNSVRASFYLSKVWGGPYLDKAKEFIQKGLKNDEPESYILKYHYSVSLFGKDEKALSILDDCSINGHDICKLELAREYSMGSNKNKDYKKSIEILDYLTFNSKKSFISKESPYLAYIISSTQGESFMKNYKEYSSSMLKLASERGHPLAQQKLDSIESSNNN